MRKSKRMEATLSQDAAKQMLSNVFEACEYEKNRVPMEVLQSYSAYRRERYLLQRIVLVVVMLLFLLVPVLFINVDVELNWVADADPGRPIVQMIARGIMPIQSVEADIDGFATEVYHVAEETYRIHPDRNGTLTVRITLKNKQYAEHTLQVTDVDKTPPELVSSGLEDGRLKIFLRDDSGEINFESIYAMDIKGNTVYPLGYNEEEMSVTFSANYSDLNIFVSDKYDNELQLVLKVD